MTAPAVTIRPSFSAAAAARLMIEHGVNRLPVVIQDGRVVGIVTRADLVRAFTRQDAEIALEIQKDILERVLWAEPSPIDLSVREGEVEVAGELETSTDVEIFERSSRSLRRRFAAVARHVPGSERQRREERAMRTIVIATDGSQTARDAVTFGLGLAVDQHADVALVHVVPRFDIVPTIAFGMPAAQPHPVRRRSDSCWKRPRRSQRSAVSPRARSC